jgi:hypothetical protein
MSVDDIRVDLTDPRGESHSVTASSADKALRPMQDLLKAMTRNPLTIEVDANGRIGSVKGWKAVKSAAGEAGKNLVERDFQESAYELAVLPGGVIDAAVGKQWRERFEWDHEMGTLRLDTDYELAAIEAPADVPLAVVNATSKVKFDVDTSKLPQRPDGPKFDVKLTRGSHNSQILYDLSRREAVGRHIEQTLEFQMTVSFQGRSYVTQIKSKTTTQAIRLSEQ